MTHANENIDEASLESLVNDSKPWRSIFPVLLGKESCNDCESVNMNVEFSAALSEYTDVFPEELTRISLLSKPMKTSKSN